MLRGSIGVIQSNHEHKVPLPICLTMLWGCYWQNRYLISVAQICHKFPFTSRYVFPTRDLAFKIVRIFSCVSGIQKLSFQSCKVGRRYYSILHGLVPITNFPAQSLADWDHGTVQMCYPSKCEERIFRAYKNKEKICRNYVKVSELRVAARTQYLAQIFMRFRTVLW